MIPIMPFHTILLENIRCILQFVGRGPYLRTQSKRLNMETTARGSAQMFAFCSSAPAARTSQLGNCTEEQTPTNISHPLPSQKSPICSSSDLVLPLADKPSFSHRSPVQRRQPGATEPELGLWPRPIFIAGKWDTHHHRLQALMLAPSKKKSCSGVWLPFIERKSLLKSRCL